MLPTYESILNHPFNRELADGTLAMDKFIFYIEQDALYLSNYSKVLASISNRVHSGKLTATFLNFARGALFAEQELHSHFLHGSPKQECIEPSPACLAYTRYLLATVMAASVEEAIAAILPCFWIYQRVGQHILKSTVRNNPYALWINTYASQEFLDATNLAISILDETAEASPPYTLELMERAFQYTFLFEWEFWNDAYKMVRFRKPSLMRL